MKTPVGILQLYWDIDITVEYICIACAVKVPGTIAGDGLADQRIAWMMAGVNDVVAPLLKPPPCAPLSNLSL